MHLRQAASFLAALSLAVWCNAALAQEKTQTSADEAYRLAVGLHNIPLYEEAAVKFKAFLQTYPNDARLDQVRYKLGDCLLHLEKHDEALAAFEDVVAGYPKSAARPEAMFRVGEIMALKQRRQEAADTFARFLKEFAESKLADAAREKEAAASIELLYSNLQKDPVKTLTIAGKLAARTDPVGEQALLVQGSLLFNKADYAGAVKTYAEFAKRFPDSTGQDEASLNAANAYLHLKNDEAALAALGRIKGARQDEVQYLRGTILRRRGDDARASESFQFVANNHKASRFRPYCLFELGLMGRRAAWRTLREEHGDTEPANEARYLEAADLAEKGKPADAIPLLDRVAVSSPRRTEADLLKIELQAKESFQEAAKGLAAMEARGVKGQILASARYALGLGALAGNRSDEAVKIFGLVLNEPSAAGLHADCLYRTGLAYEQAKKDKPALETYERLVKNYAKDKLAPYGLLRIGALQVETNPAAAIAALNRIAGEYPGFEHESQAAALILDARYREAWDAYIKKEYRKAAAAFDAVKKHPKHGAEAAYLAGVSYQNGGNTADAESSFRFLLKEHPDYIHAADARTMLGELLAGQKKWQDAATHFSSYVKTIEDPKARAAVELKLGVALYELNQTARARESFEFAAGNGEPAVRAKALFFQGEMLFAQKKYAEAKETFLQVGVLYRHEELTPAALLEAARCMEMTGEKEKSRTILDRLVKEFPKSPHADEAGRMLKAAP